MQENPRSGHRTRASEILQAYLLIVFSRDHLYDRAYGSFIGIREDENYGLDASNVIFEKYPLVFTDKQTVELKRI